MSIKDLFNNPGTPKIQKTVTSDELVETVESSDYVEAKTKEFGQFIPPIDFSDPSNFAKFGSAELYYQKAFERIHNEYPYDGTLAEKIEFENSSSYLDKYVFDNLYPRTNGYVNFDGTNFIDIDGGPHTASSGMSGKPLDETFDKSMIYEESLREGAFNFDPEKGFTIEFWMKKDDPVPSSEIQLLFEVSNRDKFAYGGMIAPYSIIFLYINDAQELSLDYARDTGDYIEFSGAVGTSIGEGWNHYALSIKSSPINGSILRSYKNGQMVDHREIPEYVERFEDINAGINATIGGLMGDTAFYSRHDLPFIGSIDEFRFWKTERSPEQIFNSWFSQVGGGTNKHDANLDLSVYYKFNEGITGNSDLDKIVLDYSGRINNGVVSGYSTAFRSTGSAITEKLGEPEFLDPIIYSSHPDVIAKKAELMTSGSLADLNSTSQFIGYFPSWMQEEDEQQGNQLKNLSQILGSYFDTLWHQIDFVDKVHDQHFISGSDKALPFAKKLLYDRGFVMPDLFVDAKITENLMGKDDNEIYEKQINEVRNIIYHNIYNNLETIYKSKGTEKSFRNFFRSAGIGQDLVKLNLYADDSTFVLRDNYEFKSLEKKFVDFNKESNFSATIYQSSSNGDYYIPGDKDYLGSLTFETELILPKKPQRGEIGHFPFPDLESSVAGFHSTGSLYDFPVSDLGMSIYVIKSTLENQIDEDSQRVKFKLSCGAGDLESPEIPYQYLNNKWNLAVRMRHSNYPYANVVGNVEDDYVLEFYGVEADGNTKRNSFSVSTAITADYFRSDKIFYAGAERTNYSGSVITNSDIRLGSVRYWHSYLSDSAIDKHAFDPETFGANEPFESDLVNTYEIEIPREKTLALHWSFNSLTGSDSLGEMNIPDLSSGSVSPVLYGSLAQTIGQINEGKAIGFNPNDSKALDKDFLHVARKRRPDDLMSSDLTTIKSEETENFFVDEDVSDNFYSFEKSMWGVISDEMLNMFSTALDLNNLIGQPNQKYHHRYNMADFLRDRFFDDVENEPDIEKFTSFYKWIDDSISIALQQLIPASARFSEKINNIIESHVLERNKYVHQFPILTNFESTEGSIKGISEMKYDWKHGHAPKNPEEEQFNVLWQKERKEKEIDSLQEILRTSRNNHSLQSSGLTRKEIDGSTRIEDTYAVRRFAKTHDFSVQMQQTIHGGTNFSRNKNLQFFHESIQPAGTIEPLGQPTNVITVGLGEGTGIIEEQRNEDNLPRKKKYNAIAEVQKQLNNEYAKNVKSDIVFPMNIMSGTVHTGYNKQVKEMYRSDVIFTNLHNDTVGISNEISMQGPFTEGHVGGLQYRHIDINKFDSNKSFQVPISTISSYPTGLLEFDTAVLSQKYSEGTGSWVRVIDADGTRMTAYYAPFYDFYDNQWSTIEELSYLISHKLDVETKIQSPTILELTQSTSGSFYNNTIITDANNYITASGFAGGLAASTSYVERNLDHRGQRPEGWGLLFKTHIRENDSDGAFGFVGADYGTPYPYPYYAKATRYREEHAKRPINVKNIKTSPETQRAGNFKSEIEIFSVASEHQKTWAIEAYNDPNIDILPPMVASSLPESTHYQTLVSRLPLDVGNVFGQFDNNRQITATPETQSLAINSGDTNIVFRMASSTSITGYSGFATGGKTLSFWINLDNNNLAARFIARGQAATTESFSLFFSYSGAQARLLFRVTGATGSRVWYWNVDYNDYVGIWNHLAVTWDGDTTNLPILYKNGSPTTAIALSGVNGVTTIYVPTRIYLFDDGTSSNSNYELQGSLQDFAIYSGQLNTPSILQIYNSGVVRDTPYLSSNLFDYWRLGNDTTFSVGDSIPASTIISSSYGFMNHLTSSTVAPDGLLTIVAGANTETRRTSPNLNQVTNTILSPRTDLTGSQRNINTRFSAPGGIEVQTISYLDAYTQTYSVHNALPWRNLSVLGSGSGEEGTIRVEDHLGLRRGLSTLRTLHSGKFGIDSQYGEITSNDYPLSGSYNKQHRNTSHRLKWNDSSDEGLSGTELITGSAYDNMHINTPIPRSELQYSWINAAIAGDDAPQQNILGYAPRDGIVSSSLGFVDAIVFPSASSIFAS